MDVETLKCNGQCSNMMHALAISMNFLRQTVSLTHLLRCLHNTLSGSGIDELLYFAIALMNSSSKKGLYFSTGLLSNSSSKFKSIW